MMQVMKRGNRLLRSDRVRLASALWVALMPYLLATMSAPAVAQIAFQAQPPIATSPSPGLIAECMP